MNHKLDMAACACNYSIERQGHENHCKFEARLWDIERSSPGETELHKREREEKKESQINNRKTFSSVYLLTIAKVIIVCVYLFLNSFYCS